MFETDGMTENGDFLVMRKFCLDVIYVQCAYYFAKCDKTCEETWSDLGPGRDRSRGPHQNEGRILALTSERLTLEFCSGYGYVC
jgi:hypothetical protein